MSDTKKKIKEGKERGLKERSRRDREEDELYRDEEEEALPRKRSGGSKQSERDRRRVDSRVAPKQEEEDEMGETVLYDRPSTSSSSFRILRVKKEPEEEDDDNYERSAPSPFRHCFAPDVKPALSGTRVGRSSLDVKPALPASLPVARVTRSSSSYEEARPMPDFKKEPQICKYWLEGNCPNSADECQFDHEGVVERSFEKCKYYMTKGCKKGKACPFLHEQFPCWKYHLMGKCEDSPCKFSHEELTDQTRPLFQEEVLFQRDELEMRLEDGESKDLIRKLAEIDTAMQRLDLRPPEGPSPDAKEQVDYGIYEGPYGKTSRRNYLNGTVNLLSYAKSNTAKWNAFEKASLALIEFERDEYLRLRAERMAENQEKDDDGDSGTGSGWSEDGFDPDHREKKFDPRRRSVVDGNGYRVKSERRSEERSDRREERRGDRERESNDDESRSERGAAKTKDGRGHKGSDKSENRRESRRESEVLSILRERKSPPPRRYADSPKRRREKNSDKENRDQEKKERRRDDDRQDRKETRHGGEDRKENRRSEKGESKRKAENSGPLRPSSSMNRTGRSPSLERPSTSKSANLGKIEAFP